MPYDFRSWFTFIFFGACVMHFFCGAFAAMTAIKSHDSSRHISSAAHHRLKVVIAMGCLVAILAMPIFLLTYSDPFYWNGRVGFAALPSLIWVALSLLIQRRTLVRE